MEQTACPAPFPTLPSTLGNLIDGQMARWQSFLIEWDEEEDPSLYRACWHSTLAALQKQNRVVCFLESNYLAGLWPWVHPYRKSAQVALTGSRARVDGRGCVLNVCVRCEILRWGE